MSKLIARFPHQPPYIEIYISLGGVELHVAGVAAPTVMTLDPVQARTLATLLVHASNEAEMMQMRKKLEDERPEPSPIQKPRFSGG